MLSSGRIRAWVLDLGLAGVFVVVAQVELHHRVDDGYQAGPMWLNVPLVALMAAPVAFRSVAPGPALAVAVAATAVPGPFVAHTIFFWGSLVPLALMTYSLARLSDRWAARHCWLTGPLILAANSIHVDELRSLSNWFFGIGLFGIAWLVGRVLRRLSLQGEQLRTALDALAGEQALREEAAVESERHRIAGEMHDVVAHAVSLMVVQVGAARLTLDRDGVTPPDELLAAEETGRQALTELRRTLGLLRSTTAEPGEPLPGTASIAALVDRCRAAGVPVTVDGDPPDRFTDLAPSLQLAMHRVVQEALTNVVKHAGATPTTMTLRREPQRVTVTVVNAPGRSTGTPGSGMGLPGMRQRTRLFGGDLDASATPDGGFAVTAVFPLHKDLTAPPPKEVDA